MTTTDINFASIVLDRGMIVVIINKDGASRGKRNVTA